MRSIAGLHIWPLATLTSFSWVVNSLKSAPFGSAVQLYSSGQGVTVSLVVKGVVFRLYLST